MGIVTNFIFSLLFNDGHFEESSIAEPLQNLIWLENLLRPFRSIKFTYEVGIRFIKRIKLKFHTHKFHIKYFRSTCLHAYLKVSFSVGSDRPNFFFSFASITTAINIINTYYMYKLFAYAFASAYCIHIWYIILLLI